ncbi:hypothetical protein JL12_10955 [Gallibacterium anatis 10672-6]|uniref:hypothetical protein n=1 Tax=Gallibacterium anatis TaxID=750 RepID=UPI000530C819|nr:hypothetical protein [Gallibacterium anatis]KGQ47629.1 hypothetical protein JL12_10955 [Gallibacterium anatis 10672-6]
MTIAINEMKNIVHHLNLTTLNDVNMFQQLSSFIDQLLLSNNSSDKLLALQIQQKLYENPSFIDYQKKVKEDLALLKKENKTDEEKPKPIYKERSTDGQAEVKKQEEKKNTQEEKKLHSLVYSQMASANMTWFKALSFEQKVQALSDISDIFDNISNLFPPYSDENKRKIENALTAINLTINELVELKRTGQISDEEYIKQKELIEKNEIYKKAQELSLREGNLTLAQYIDICEASSKFLFYAAEKYNLPFKIKINDSGKPQTVPDTVENRLFLAKMQQDFILNDNTLKVSQKDYMKSEIATNLIIEDVKNVSDKIISNSLTQQEASEEIYKVFNKFQQELAKIKTSDNEFSTEGCRFSPIMVRSFFNNIGANGIDSEINMGIRHLLYKQVSDFANGDKSALVNNPLVIELVRDPENLKTFLVGLNFNKVDEKFINDIIKSVEDNKNTPLPVDDRKINFDQMREQNNKEFEAFSKLEKLFPNKDHLEIRQILSNGKLTEEQINELTQIKEQYPEDYRILNEKYKLDQIINPTSKVNISNYLNDKENDQYILTQTRNELVSTFYKNASNYEIETAKRLQIKSPQFNNEVIASQEKLNEEEMIKRNLENQHNHSQNS